MKTISSAAVVAVSCLLLLPAQQKIRVDLGNNVALVGEISEIHLNLDTQGNRVTLLETNVSFPPIISFSEAAVAEGIDDSSWKVTSEIMSTDNSTSHAIKLRIQAEGQDSLPDGGIVVLKFKVSEEIGDEEIVEVPLEGRSRAIDESGSEMEVVENAGSITVMDAAPEVVACFFYMH